MDYRLKRIIDIYEANLNEEGKKYLFDTAEMFVNSPNLKELRKKDPECKIIKLVTREKLKCTGKQDLQL